MPSLRASATAMASLFESTMNSASGSRFMLLIPERLVDRCLRSRSSLMTSFFRNRILRLALGPDKQHQLARRRQLSNELRRLFEHLQRLLQIDDVNAVAFAEDIFLHLRIPALRLVTEVDASLEQFLHGDVCQCVSLVKVAGAGLMKGRVAGAWINPVRSTRRREI